MMMSVASREATLRWTVTGTRLASSSGPRCNPTISTRNGGGSFAALPGCGTMAKAFITSKIPVSVETAASGIATRLTWNGSVPVWVV